jgi:hypothetical protein
MKAIETEPIDNLIGQLEANISVSESLGLGLTKLLLSMARLDLQMRRHAIGGRDLRKLCTHYERILSRHSLANPSGSGGGKAKLPTRAITLVEAREPSAGKGAPPTGAASVRFATPLQADVSFRRRQTGSRKPRRR